MNIYDLRGPEFIQLTLAAEFVAAGLAFLARKAVLSYNTGRLEEDQKPFDHYEAAYLNGGVKHLFLTVLTVLEHENKITLDLTEKRVSLKEQVGANAHILERLVANALWKHPTSISTVFESVRSSMEKTQERMRNSGLAPSREQATLAVLLPLQILSLPILFLAIPKLVSGWLAHKPIGFLMGLITVFVAITICILRKEVFRTTEGDRILDSWKKERTALRDNFRVFAKNMGTKDVAIAYALFAAFSFNLLNPYKQAVASNSSGHMWDYSPASCSSAGCGGASSGCSGGGGCGGGCGGCGGG